MNKELSFACIFSFCLVLAFACVANASFLEVTEDIAIVGNGSFERDFGVQSSPGYDGQKLFESVLPVYSVHGNYATSYRSNFELIMSDNSSIFYESASKLSNSKHYLASKNYKLGVYTGFDFIGAQNKTFSFEASPSLSEAIVSSKAEGRSVLHFRVVNLTDHHIRNVDDVVWMEGNYDIDWNALVLNWDYPEAGDDDWLHCP
ncbi:hypothetical protein [ANMV-1 virus]|nr:hypothetical protein [ANMV-1 virus]